MSISIEKTIDIDKILKSKMGSKAKFVPRFLVSWLKKIVHEDEVNKFLWESRNLSGTEWLTECVRYLKMDVEIVGLENLPYSALNGGLIKHTFILILLVLFQVLVFKQTFHHIPTLIIKCCQWVQSDIPICIPVHLCGLDFIA